MPIEFLYLAIVFAVAILGFTLLKRPLYECILVSFLVLIAVTGTWGKVGGYIYDAMRSSSLYVIIVFIITAQLLTKTKVIDDCIAIILSIFGRIRGGAGYVAIIGSTYMGSLSGSGPGNVAATGVFTIPAMKESGFPAHLAANVEAHSSTMGNMIPPAGMIAVAFAELDALYPGKYTISQYWLLLWGIALWFILQRIVTLYFMCVHYKVKPMKKEDIPSFRASLRQGWRAVFLPLIVFLPFFLDSKCADFFASRLSGGASAFSNSILLIVPSLIVVCGILLSGRETMRKMSLPTMFAEICRNMTKVIPTASLVMFAYFVSNLLDDLQVGAAIGEFIASLNVNYTLLVFLVPLFTAILGMLIPGSTQIKIFGSTIISVLAAAGGNPMLAAGMLPCICGAMHGVTPPYSVCVYTAMGIADSRLKETLLNCTIWIVIHYLLSVIVMLQFLPVAGLL